MSSGEFDLIEKNIMQSIDRSIMLACFANFLSDVDNKEQIINDLISSNKKLLLNTFNEHYGLANDDNNSNLMDTMFRPDNKTVLSQRKDYENKIDRIGTIYKSTIKEILDKSL